MERHWYAVLPVGDDRLAGIKAVLKVDPKKLPLPPYPPTKPVRTIEKPDRPYEAIDYASRYKVDEEKMAERRRRAGESTRRMYAARPAYAYTPAQEELIIKLYKQGVRTADIAERIGKSKTAVKQKIEKLRKVYGFEREAPLQRQYIHHKPENEIVRKNHYTHAQDAVIREMRGQGKTYAEIGEEIGKSKEAVRRRWYRIQ